jgi:hypothetical protein
MQGLSIALYQPDIAGNTGTILRLAACMGMSVELIMPAGFDPVRVTDAYSNGVTEQIYESLLTYDYLSRPARLVRWPARPMRGRRSMVRAS